MDTTSSPYVQEAIRTFEEARVSDKYQATDLQSACIRADQINNEIQNKITNRAIEINEALSKTRILGTLAGIFDAHRTPDNSAQILTIFAHLLPAASIPNPDIAHRTSAKLHQDAADEYIAIQSYREAAICITNAAASLINVRNETPEDRQVTLKILERGLSLKRKHGQKLDIAYTLANMATARRKIAEIDKVQPSVNFNRAWAEASSAIKILNRIQDTGAPIPLEILSTLTDIVIGWISYDGGKTGADTSDKVLKLRTKERQYVLELLDSQIARAESQHEEVELGWHRSRLSDILTHGTRLTEEVYKSVEHLWRIGRYEELILRGTSFINPPLISEQKYAQFLIWVSEAFYRFRLSRDNQDSEFFLRANAQTLRFAACSLLRLGKYEHAFRALELSRGISLPETLDQVDFERGLPEDVVFVHLTHSPEGIGCSVATAGVSENQYTGRFFARDMREFSRSFHQAELGDPPGLVVSQMMGRRDATARRARELSESFQEIADYIISSCPQGKYLVIVPGGYFQAFPVTSISASDGTPIIQARTASISPSVMSHIQSGFSLRFSYVALVVADAAPGLPELTYTLYDEAAIRHGGFDVKSIPPERDALLAQEKHFDFLQFSGHSSSSADPTESHLSLHSGKITAADILRGDIQAEGVFLSSCQSGMNLHVSPEWGEEVLSLQSAFFYRGSSLCIGTSWPVLDSAAHIFSLLFYMNLPQRAQSPEDWQKSFRSAQLGLRDITVAEIHQLLLDLGHPPNTLPWLNANANYLPFSEFYLWAPFTLMLRT